MDAQTIQLLASSPVIIVLIYLVIRQQLQIEKLLGEICDIQVQHSKDLMELQLKMADKLLLENSK